MKICSNRLIQESTEWINAFCCYPCKPTLTLLHRIALSDRRIHYRIRKVVSDTLFAILCGLSGNKMDSRSLNPLVAMWAQVNTYVSKGTDISMHGHANVCSCSNRDIFHSWEYLRKAVTIPQFFRNPKEVANRSGTSQLPREPHQSHQNWQLNRFSSVIQPPRLFSDKYCVSFWYGQGSSTVGPLPNSAHPCGLILGWPNDQCEQHVISFSSH